MGSLAGISPPGADPDPTWAGRAEPVTQPAWLVKPRRERAAGWAVSHGASSARRGAGDVGIDWGFRLPREGPCGQVIAPWLLLGSKCHEERR